MGIVKRFFRGWRNFIRYLNRKLPYLGLAVHFISTVGIAFVLFTMASSFLVDVTTVRGQSMEPTLQEDDRLLTLRFGRFFSNLLGAEYIPKRGEIVVFSKDGSQDHLLIKRVVGLPDERVVIKNQTITVYNGDYPEGFQPDLGFDNRPAVFGDEVIDVYVGRGELFVLGDNLAVSADSRSIGNILVDNINGNLIIRTWPFSKFTFF